MPAILKSSEGPHGTTRLCRPIDQWPEADRIAWEAARDNPRDPFSDAPQRDWSPTTWRYRAKSYGRFLSWLDGNGLLDSVADAASRVTRDRLRVYLADLATVNGDHTLHSRIGDLAAALRVIAPAADWGWIQRAAGRLRAEAVNKRDKFSRLRPIQNLLAEGLALCEAAEADPEISEWRRAIDYRDGLMIAFLALHPFRAADMTSIQLDKQLLKTAAGFGLNVPTSKSRGKTIVNGAMNPILIEPLLRYLDRYRPLLAAKRQPH